MWTKPSTMDLSKELSLFMAREGGGEREGEFGGKHFATYYHGEARGGGRNFFNALFLWMFLVIETLHVLELLWGHNSHIKACF